jgi:hypothetical protein
MFASVCVCSSQDAKVTWTKALSKATPQKKTLWRSSEVQEIKEVLPRQTIWSGALDCPVHQGTVAQQLVLGGDKASDCPVWYADCPIWKPAASMVTCSVRSTARRTGQGHRTVRCAAESNNFYPTTSFVLGAINTPQPDLSMCGSPSNIQRHKIDISKCSYTQLLNRITRWLA